jgi:SAM-dependent methyltransferase
MRPAEYEAMYRVEDTHWWYGALRRQVSRAVIAEGRRLGRAPRVLDAGAGTGGMLARLGGGGELYGVEIASEGLRFCQERGLEGVVQGSVTALPFAGGAFDIVLSLDVLYHQSVPDDREAAGEHTRVLRPGGLLVLNLPAYDALRGAHDAAIHTARRYTRSGVLRLLKGAGLRPERVTHWNTLLLPAAVAVRLLSRGRAGEAGSDVQPVAPALNALLSAVLRLEATWLRRADLPLGLSVFALARKADRSDDRA